MNDLVIPLSILNEQNIIIQDGAGMVLVTVGNEEFDMAGLLNAAAAVLIRDWLNDWLDK